MAQNVYDQQQFFEGYSAIPRSQHGLSPLGAPEWAVLSSHIPPLQGKTFLDLGCGFGWYCRWAADQGASSVLGIDISSNMLDVAQRTTENEMITYRRADLEKLELTSGGFDLVFSSLSLHYISNLGGLMGEIFKSLKPGGSLVFSVEHPTVSAPKSPKPEWTFDSQGRKKSWPLNGYLDEGERRKDWFIPGVVRYHRTVASYVKMMIGLGFLIRGIDEWGPSLQQIESGECGWSGGRERPLYLLVKGSKPY